MSNELPNQITCCVATEACKGDSFLCEDEQRRCIRADQRCDGYKNCESGFDEKNCGERKLYNIQNSKKSCAKTDNKYGEQRGINKTH
jgi:hypothetical protein